MNRKLVFKTLGLVESDIKMFVGIAQRFDKLVSDIIVNYKPPNYPVQRFPQSLQTHIRKIQKVHILGDFNQTGNDNLIFLHKLLSEW
jgi:hypothetical protein